MTKVCATCREEKPLTEFYRRARSGRQCHCRTCARVAVQKWRAENPDKVRAAWQRWAAANPRRSARQAWAEWDRANPEKRPATDARYYAANREGVLLRSARWCRENPHKNRARVSARRARQRNAGGAGITGDQWQQILADSLGICAYCNERRRLTLDHIEPLSRGGEHDVENAAATCAPCNSSKNDTPLLLWLARRRSESNHQQRI